MAPTLSVVDAAGKYRWERQRTGIYCSVVAAAAGGSTRFVAAEWGKGVHDEKSTCPYGCYTLHYRIDVIRL